MKNYRIIYQRLSQKVLVDIFEYIRIDNPAAAHNLLDRFDKNIARLKIFPSGGIAPRDESLKLKGYRVVVVGDYLIFYLVSGRTIQIRRIIRGKERILF